MISLCHWLTEDAGVSRPDPLQYRGALSLLLGMLASDHSQLCPFPGSPLSQRKLPCPKLCPREQPAFSGWSQSGYRATRT